MGQLRPEQSKKKNKIWFLAGAFLCIVASVCIGTLLLSTLFSRADGPAVEPGGTEYRPTTLPSVMSSVTVYTESAGVVDISSAVEKYTNVAPTQSVALLPGERICFSLDRANFRTDAKVQYIAAGGEFLTNLGDSNIWSTLDDGAYFSPRSFGNSGYVYFRVNNSYGQNFEYSDIAVFHYTTLDDGAPTISTQADFQLVKVDDVELTTVDIGDTIYVKPELLTDALKDSVIFYNVGNESKMSFSLMSDFRDTQSVETLRQLKLRFDIYTESLYMVTGEEADREGIGSGNYCYIRLDGLWYRNEGDVSVYDANAGIQVDESVREGNAFVVKMIVFQSGKVLGSETTVSLPYEIRSQLKGVSINPVTTESTNEEGILEIPINQTISFQNDPLNANYNCTILYTTSRNAPTYSVRLNRETNRFEVVPTGQTMIYDRSFRLDSNIASYGANFYLSVMVVSYETQNGYQMAKNSTVQTFTYHIQSQSAVAAVRSTPATSADTVTEVKVGDVIMLHSATPNVSIFYTTDGTEPQISASGTPGSSSTIAYLPSQGVIVPDIDDTVFTITAVAYSAELASSDISRLTFRYPSAVSAPYAVPTSGTVTENTQVLLRTATVGAVIHYTIAYGGQTPADPTTNSAVYTEDLPILIDRQTTIKAIAVYNGTASNVNTFRYTVYGKLSVPVPAISSGSVVSKGTVVYLVASTGSTIYYTVDGSNPKDSENKAVFIGNTVIIDGDPGTVVTVRTYAGGSNASVSETGVYNFTISNFEGGVFADKDTDSILEQNAVVTLTTDVTSGAIYYTLDGTMPTTSSASGRTVTISGEPGTKVTLKAAAISYGGSQITSAATYSYTIMPRLQTVKSSVPTGAIFTAPTYVILSADGGNIYYTTNGTTPTGSSLMYQEPIYVDREMTIRAMAVQNGNSNSEISTFTYGFAEQVSQPECSHSSGELEIGTEISFTCDTEGALLYYTTNGVDPDINQMDRLQLYTGAIPVARATTYKVIAVKDRMQNSAILTVGFTVKEKVVIEQEQTGITEMQDTGSSRLKSRRTYDSSAAGPEFTDIILRNVNYGASVSAEGNTIPQTAVLQVDRTNVTDSTRALIKQRLSDVYEIVTSYDITLWEDSVQIQPDGLIEIGLPIPSEYENAVVYVAYVGDDGIVELPSVRRYGGVAYVKTDHLSVYSIVVPQIAEENNMALWIRIGAIAAAVILLILGRWLISRQRKREQADAAW